MKVKQLIEELSKIDQDLEVVIFDCEWGYFLANTPKIINNTVIKASPFDPNDTDRNIGKTVMI